ncbi:MAG: heparinase II/III family protein [Bdellovibrionia bacterium]
MGSMKKQIAISSAVLMASGSALAGTVTLSGTGVDVPAFLMSNCTAGPGSNTPDFIDNSDPSVVRLQPRECGLVKTGTPAFSWVAPQDRASTPKYFFWLNKAGSNEAVVTKLALDHPWVNLTTQLPNGKLDAGVYYWSAAYINSQGKTVFSRVRYFQIPAGSETNVFPSGAQIAASVGAKASPRILPPNVTFPTLASRASVSTDYRNAYTKLMAEAKAAVAGTPPIPPADTAPTSGNLMHLTAGERRLMEELALAGLFTGNSTYSNAAIKRLMALAAWSPTGMTSQDKDDQSNREILLALAEGLDLLRAKLTTTQINTVLVPLKARILSILNGPNQSIASFDGWPNDSHMLTDIQYLNEALMHVAGMPGFPESSSYLATAWEYYRSALNTFNTDDGSYANGVAYGWYGLGQVANTMAAVRLIGGVDVSSQPSIARIGRYLIAMTPANIFQMNAYGDGAEVSNLYQQGTIDAFKLYSALNTDPAYEWYWRVTPQNNSLQYYPGLWHFMTLGMNNGAPIALPSPAAPKNMSWLFENTGAVAMHGPNTNPDDLTTSTMDTNRSSVFFHSGRFGSFNHSQADQNAFTLVSNGENVLISGGYYVNYDHPDFKLQTRATRYKNALTFDGGIGQAEPSLAPTAPGAPVSTMYTRGKLLNMYDSASTWVVTTGDATDAYRGTDGSGKWQPLLSKVIRTVAYNRKDKVAVVYDYATSDTARTWELNFQSMAPFNVNVNMANTKSANGKASACIDMYDPVGGNFTASQGFEINPTSPFPDANHPQQYHARYSLRMKLPQLVAVTIIRESCAGMGRSATFNGTKATVTVNGGAPLVFDKETVIVPN